jgi:plasmid stability protein
LQAINTKALLLPADDIILISLMEVRMSDVLIRNLDDEVVSRLKSQAKHAGQSVNTFLKIVLTKEAMRTPRSEVVKELAELRATSRTAPDTLSTDILRDLRDGKEQRF